MNRTIRSNCFETNSSSTHSITITFDSACKTVELVSNNCLIPKRLSDSSAYTTPGRYSDSRIVTCRTKDQKSALFVQHMQYFQNSPPYKFSKVRASMLATYSYDLIKDLCGYLDIDLDFCPEFYYGSDDGDSYMEMMMGDGSKTDDSIKRLIQAHVLSVILNDDAVIHDTEDSN